MDVLMPTLGETVEAGKITKWFKSPGELVKLGDNLFEIETDKASIEVPSTTAGTLAEIYVATGGVASVGAVIAVIAEPAGVMPSSPDGVVTFEYETNDDVFGPVINAQPPAQSSNTLTSQPDPLVRVGGVNSPHSSSLRPMKEMLLSFAILCVAGSAVIVFFVGTNFVFDQVIPNIQIIDVCTVFVGIFVVGPLAFFRTTRPAAAFGFLVAGCIFCLSNWTFALTLIWARPLIVPVILVAIGLTVSSGLGFIVAPPAAAIIVALEDQAWSTAAAFSIGVLLTFGVLVLSARLGSTISRDFLLRGLPAT
jgi:hypothetical protein